MITVLIIEVFQDLHCIDTLSITLARQRRMEDTPSMPIQ